MFLYHLLNIISFPIIYSSGTSTTFSHRNQSVSFGLSRSGSSFPSLFPVFLIIISRTQAGVHGCLYVGLVKRGEQANDMLVFPFFQERDAPVNEHRWMLPREVVPVKAHNCY